MAFHHTAEEGPEEGRGLNDNPIAIARACEEVLLSSGLFDEGKWFAAAKEAGLYDEALALASLPARTVRDEFSIPAVSSKGVLA